jgi:hypothetical protein
MVQEETVIEGKTRISVCERLALVWGSGDDDLSDAHIFKVGACSRRHPTRQCGGSSKKENAAALLTFYLLVETVKQTLLIVLRNNLQRRRREKVAHAILEFIWERDTDMDRPARR